MHKDNVFKYLTINSVYLWLILFSICPLTLVVICSFLQHTPDQLFVWKFTLANYKTLLTPIYLKVFWRSLELAFWVTVLCLIIGYPFAYFLTRLPSKIKGLMALFVIIPFWTSSLLRSYAIITIIQAHGLLNTFLMKIGVIDQPLQLLYTNTAVIIGLVYNLLPFVVLPLFSNMEKLDRRLIDAARDLGANGPTTFLRIILPLTKSGIYSAIMLTFLPAMTLFYIPDLLGGAKSLLLGNVIQTQFLSAENWPLGSALSLTLTVVMSLLLWFYFRSTPRSEREAL